MREVARPFLSAVLIAAVINVPLVLAASVGAPIPGIFLAFTLTIGSILVFLGAIVSVVRIFKWAGE